MGEVLIRPHALSERDELLYNAPAGTTLQEIANEVWPIEAHDCVVLTVDGDVIPWEYWHVTTPKDGAMVRGTLTFGKGGGGKNILSMVAMIAVAIAAPYAGAALFGAGTMGATVAAVGFSMVGAMAVNAIFKPTLAGPGTGRYTDPKESNTYNITGQSNDAVPYSAIPRVYGTHRVYPKLAATPFVVTEGSEQYLYMLLDFGFGPLSVDNLRIGETPLGQYQEVQYRLINDFVKGSFLSLYPSDVAVESVSSELVQGAWVSRRTEADTIMAGIDIAFPRGLVRFNDQGNKLNQSCSFAIEVSVVGSGVWQPYSYYGARTTSPAVAQVAGPVFLFTRGVHIPGLGVPTYGLPAGSTTGYISSSGGIVPAVGNRLIWPDGLISTITSATFDSQTYLYTVTFAALSQDKVFGTYSSAYLQVPMIGNGSNAFTVTAATSEPLYISMNISLPVGQYDVRVVRTSAAAADSRTMSQSYWSAIRSNANRAPIAPTRPHCIMELKIRASEQLSGVIQKLNAIATAILPSWNGSSWVTTLTDNPAAAFLDVLRGSANRTPVADDQIDFASLQRWSEWCDLPAQDGLPYYRFSHVVDYSTTMYQLLNSIAAAGRATLSFIDGKIGVIIDQLQTVPAQMFTPRNSWGLESVRSYLPAPHALRVSFNDAGQGYEARQFYVYADGYDESNATVFEDIQTFGVTRHGQAWREGRYMLAQGLLRREQFTIQVDVENLACLRGDLVLVQHDVIKVGGESSRVVSIAGAVITQHDPIPTLEGGYTYGVRIRRADGTYTAPVTATNTGANQWTTATALTGVAPDDLLVWGIYGTETGQYLVSEITPGEDFTATVTMVELAPNIYTSDTGTIPPYVPPQSGRPAGIGAQPPTNVKLTQRNFTVGRRPAADIIITWSPPRVGNYAKYIVQTHAPQGNVVNVGNTDRNKLEAVGGLDVLTSAYTNRQQYWGVAAVDYVGSTSDTVWLSQTVSNPMSVPDPVQYLASNVTGQTTTLTWRDPVAQTLGNEQIIGYDVRWSPAQTATFAQATRVSELIAWPTATLTVPTRNGVYMIKPYTSSGVYASEEKRTAVITQELIRDDYYAQVRFEPDWLGTFINTVNGAGELRLDVDGDGNFMTRGYWVAEVPYTFIQSLTVRLQAYISAYGYTFGETLDSAKYIPLANAVPFGSAGESNKYDAKLWVSEVSPLINGGTDVDLSLARPIINGSIETDTVWFTVELRSFDLQTSPSVVIGGCDIDFPEREEYFPDFPVAAVTSTRLTFNYPFVEAPTVSLTLQNAGTGQYAWLGAVDQYGCNIGVRDSSGAPVVGSIDVGVWGPGALTVAPLVAVTPFDEDE